MKKKILALSTLCFLLNSCVILGMPVYQSLQIGEYELADVDYNTLNIYIGVLDSILMEPLISANLSIQEAEKSDFGVDPEVVETLETTNRYIVNGDEIRYRRVQFENIRTKNHVITNVSCSLHDRGSGWAKPATQERKTHKQVYSWSFQFDGIDFKTEDGNAGYIEQDYKSYLIDLFGQGIYRGRKVSCLMFFKVQLSNIHKDKSSISFLH